MSTSDGLSSKGLPRLGRDRWVACHQSSTAGALCQQRDQEGVQVHPAPRAIIDLGSFPCCLPQNYTSNVLGFGPLGATASPRAVISPTPGSTARSSVRMSAAIPKHVGQIRPRNPGRLEPLPEAPAPELLGKLRHILGPEPVPGLRHHPQPLPRRTFHRPDKVRLPVGLQGAGPAHRPVALAPQQVFHHVGGHVFGRPGSRSTPPGRACRVLVARVRAATSSSVFAWALIGSSTAFSGRWNRSRTPTRPEALKAPRSAAPPGAAAATPAAPAAALKGPQNPPP